MSLINSLRWTLRKGFWNFIAMRKYRKATPQNVTTIAPTSFQVNLVPLNKTYPTIPITDIRVAERVPEDEERTSDEGKMRRLA